jgi:hypothetical protein
VGLEGNECTIKSLWFVEIWGMIKVVVSSAPWKYAYQMSLNPLPLEIMYLLINTMVEVLLRSLI